MALKHLELANYHFNLMLKLVKCVSDPDLGIPDWIRIEMLAFRCYMEELEGSYLHHKELKAAQGVKISAQGLEHAIAGTSLYVVKPEDDLEELKKIVMQDVEKVMSRIDKSGEGVYVQASTLGSLEALTEFLRSPAVNIPFCDFSIGPVHKKDVMKASVMLERKKEYATILAFDVKVMADARELAEESGVRIFVADIIYHLFDQFKAYIDNLREEKKKESAEEAVFPCVLKIMPNCIFNKKDPIVLGVDIIEGILKVGTPICIPSREFIDIGRIASIEINHKQVDVAKKGQKVAIKIVGTSPEEQQKMFGRHFEIDDELVSHISRRSIDILKANYRLWLDLIPDDLTNDEWRLVFPGIGPWVSSKPALCSELSCFDFQVIAETISILFVFKFLRVGHECKGF
ncbi:hypothetical protein ZIOFF_036435 [Zingiber officinale]|uniref:Uncharacterized protein n=1 Tax=Zingiber officinale TaxID=94328 RepID=A0A8J5GDS0_ZINOF|nr:hypothetical protein ZIOFF_036435 [Zingiber officinale]